MNSMSPLTILCSARGNILRVPCGEALLYDGVMGEGCHVGDASPTGGVIGLLHERGWDDGHRDGLNGGNRDHGGAANANNDHRDNRNDNLAVRLVLVRHNTDKVKIVSIFSCKCRNINYTLCIMRGKDDEIVSF